MPCDTVVLTAESQKKQETALDRLRKSLANGSASVVIGPSGAVAFKGWSGQADGMFDVCAYRRLSASNSPELRRAVVRAEAVSGRKLNERSIAAGVHSHDGGATWGKH